MTVCGVQQILSPKSKNKIEQKFQKQPFKGWEVTKEYMTNYKAFIQEYLLKEYQ